MKRGLLCAISGALLLGALAQSETTVRARAITTGPLNFFKNFFITGDYVTGAVGLQGQGVNGLATGSIAISGVPAGMDIAAAYLYWQVVTRASLGPDSGSVGATFNGYPLSTAEGPFAKVLGEFGTAPCWSSGGGTGQSGGEKRTYTFRTDVLRFLPLGPDGEFLVNGSHTVQIPDSGSGGNSTPIALGATLVIIYRDPSKPLNAFVIYDGSSTIDNSNQTLTQTIEGFYQPAATPNARISYIAGSGQANKNELVSFNGAPIATSPFSSSAGAAWDTVERDVNPGTGSSVTTAVTTAGLSASDCLTFGAIIFKTAVKDTDGDGLLDVWETATRSAPVYDPNGQALPPLGEMFANPRRKDIFIEIGYTKTDVDLTYGGVLKPAHSHLPGHDALKLIGDAYWNAPVMNDDGSMGISLHVDAGSLYPAGIADAYIVPRHLATGGEFVDEAVTSSCVRGPSDPPWVCQFSAYPGTVGWKTGFRFLKDEILSGEPAPGPGEEDVCDLPGSTCVRRFDRNRKDIFRYAFFAHFAGLPVAEKPCLDGSSHPTDANPITGLCDVEENSLFRVPRTITGIGDFPGGDVLVTMGGFADTSGLPIATPFMQASTLMHELGHNFERRHSGEASTPETPNPNCKPTYLSVMNYLYQLRGLLDDAGRPHLDYSGQIGPTLNEQGLREGVDLGSWQARGPYRLGWYAPLVGSYLEGRALEAARHCDGSERLSTDVAMVRIDARTAAGPTDWNANGVIAPSTDPLSILDINFNGRTTARLPGVEPVEPELLTGSDDWSRILLNQVGSRRSVGGFFVDALGVLRFGPLSLDAGRADMGRADMGRADMGRADMGRADMGLGDLNLGDTGRADMGRADMGRADMGRADMGRGDQGGGDLFRGDPNAPGGELDVATAGDLANTPPNEFTACVINGTTCTAPAGATASLNDIVATFKAPHVGGALNFIVYRVPGAALLPGQTWSVAGVVASEPGRESYYVIDSSMLTNGAQYTYFAVAQYPSVTSDPSNFVTITAVNLPPTISNIADRSISMNGTTGPIAFTIGDERLGTVTLTGTSNNTTLVPNANIVFGGSGAMRTVTVTPATNQAGAATITVTVTDSSGGSTSDSFVLTVTGQIYAFSGFFTPLSTAGTSAAPTNSGLFNFGKALPIKWQLRLGTVIVGDLNSLSSLTAVPGTGSGAVCTPTSAAPTLQLLDPVTGRPTGSSTYRFGGSQFVFTWDTSAVNKSYCYRLTLALADGSAPRVTIVRFK